MSDRHETHTQQTGQLAETAGKHFVLRVCESKAGFYLGTLDEVGLPFSRESCEYWRKRLQAEQALASGTWTQRETP